MSTYDDSSLFLYPSGYKASVLFAQKPMDANGQLAFTRSNDTATRVASNGLIERVRTNLVLQSNTFSTTWTTSNASVTSGQAGYDGTNNAWLLSKSAANGHISQGPASSGSETISVYAKAGTDNWLHILVRDSASGFFGGYWDLQNGVVGSAIGATTLRIQSVGNGWYRCSASFVKSTSNYYRIYPAEGNNDTSGTSGNILIQNAQLETGDIATDYIATTTAAVSVGPVANIPRIDYLGGGCGKLLLEPQRTNLVAYSEQFNDASWTKGGTTISANTSATLDPSGYNGSDKLVEDSSTGVHRVFNNSAVTVSTSAATTYSVFAKAAERTQIYVRDNDIVGARFNLSTGTVISTEGTATATITNYGNGWYRCTITRVSSTTSGRVAVYLDNGGDSYTGNGTSGVYIFGAQIEAGAYATSYIPTLAASVTRGADACSKTGVSSLIGQTEGVIFLDFIASAQNQDGAAYSVITIFGTSTDNMQLYTLGTTLRWYALKSGVIIFDQTADQTLVAGQRYKVAFAYKSGDWALYINGVQKRTRTETNIPATSQFNFNSDSFGVGLARVENKFNQAILFKTRLPNSELAALTTL